MSEYQILGRVNLLRTGQCGFHLQRYTPYLGRTPPVRCKFKSKITRTAVLQPSPLHLRCNWPINSRFWGRERADRRRIGKPGANQTIAQASFHLQTRLKITILPTYKGASDCATGTMQSAVLWWVTVY